MDLPRYAYKNNDWQRSKINSEANLSELESKIFDMICEAAFEASEKNVLSVSFDNAWKKVLLYGQKFIRREIHTEVNAKSQTRIVVEKLVQFSYCKIENGSVDNPIEFILITPEEAGPVQLDDKAQKLKDKITTHFDKFIKELDLSNKPFPTKDKILRVIKIENPGIFLGEIEIKKIIKKIKCSELTIEYIEKVSKENNIIEILFEDNSSILMKTDLIPELFSTILPNKIKSNLQENMSLLEKIKFAFTKNNREAPDVDYVFSHLSEEISFEWMSAFYNVLKEGIQRSHGIRSGGSNTKTAFQTASLLYRYFLNKREVYLKDKEIETQLINDGRLFEKQLIKEYSQLWNTQKVLSFMTSNAFLKGTYKLDTVKDLIKKINEKARKAGRIPNIIVIKVSGEEYYIHKYRFIYLFFNQMNIESVRLKEYFIEKWAQSPMEYPADEVKFEKEIKENVNKVFYAFVDDIIPYIFRFQNPHEQLIPYKIIKDQSTLEKYKKDFNLFIKSVIADGKIKKLRELLGLNFDEMKEEIKKEKAKHSSFLKKMFGGIFKIFEFFFINKAIKEDMLQSVRNAQRSKEPFADLNTLIKTYKSKKGVTNGQTNYLRKLINKVKAQLREKNKIQKVQDKKEIAGKIKENQMKIKKMKNDFLQGQSIDELLSYYSKKCFLKLDQAKKDSEDSVKGAVNSHFRKHRGHIKCNSDSIKNYAKSIVRNNESFFSSIRDKESLEKYIELILLRVFVKKLEK